MPLKGTKPPLIFSACASNYAQFNLVKVIASKSKTKNNLIKMENLLTPNQNLSEFFSGFQSSDPSPPILQLRSARTDPVWEKFEVVTLF